MQHFDLGVFADAHHLLTVDGPSRSVGGLLARIQLAAERLCMAGGMSHRVVVADCGDANARAVAEAFASSEGFRIRHIPPGRGVERAQILAAEVFEAIAARPEIRAIVMIGGEEAYLPVADQVHRSGRALIACSAGVTQPSGAVDELITLPLDVAPVGDLIRMTVRELAAQGITQTTAAAVERELRRVEPGFSAARYGRKFRDLVRQLSGTEFSFTEPDRVEIDRAAALQPPEHGPVLEPLTTSELHRLIRQACRDLPREAAMDQHSLLAAVRSVLDALQAQPPLRARATAQGLKIQDVQKGIAEVAPGYRSQSAGITLLTLCEQAVTGTSWRVWRDPDKREHIRLVLENPTLPPSVPQHSDTPE